jgi:PAS domain S-box-containing protein
MQADTATPDEMLKAAVDAVSESGAEGFAVLDRLSAPIYVTDAEGRITYYNSACIDFAGRTPTIGEDRWCVTWRLFTKNGTFLPHADCPMAVAIREKREVRGAEAVAERPDGRRVTFRPYPTPILDAAGEVVGAVNMLIDVTDLRQVEHLRAQALHCRRLMSGINDPQTAATLKHMASEYEDQARTLARPN